MAAVFNILYAPVITSYPYFGVDEWYIGERGKSRRVGLYNEDCWGIWFQISPSRILPEVIFLFPPHCLKKKGTFLWRQALRISMTQL